MTKVPTVDLGGCTDCDGCIEVCPEVFRRNETMGYVEVMGNVRNILKKRY